MKNPQKIEFNQLQLECIIDLPLAILRIREDSFNNIINLGQNDKLYEWFDNLNQTEEVKTILIIAEENSFSEKYYQNFLSKISDGKYDRSNQSDNGSTIENIQRAIEINSLSNFARQFISSNKLIITCLKGEVVTPFFGLSLFADLRFGSEFTSFSLSHKKFGTHPDGLLPFILSKHIGLGSAIKYLITKDKIDSNEALELGLLYKVFSIENFENLCIAEAKRISLVSENVINTTKKLLYSFDNELQNYINKESRFMYR